MVEQKKILPIFTILAILSLKVSISRFNFIWVFSAKRLRLTKWLMSYLGMKKVVKMIFILDFCEDFLKNQRNSEPYPD